MSIHPGTTPDGSILLWRLLLKALFAGAAGVAWGFAAPVFSREWWLIGLAIILSHWAGMVKI